MGLSSFPTASEGVLPVLLMNTFLSIALVKDLLRSVLQAMGHRPNPSLNLEEDLAEPLPVCSRFAEEVRESVSVTLFKCLPMNSGCPVECTVCLYKFEEEEEISKLRCNHFFHRDCLDKWLDHWHSTCPLCRTSVISGEYWDA
ncbi:hypothetical protein AMTRI_Chr06g199070 [Amborella trichopoda]